VAFESYATNLAAPAGAFGGRDIYVRDLAGGSTVRASVAAGGAQPNGESMHPSISGDGRYVTFCSFATDLVAGDTNGFADVFVRDLAGGATARVSVGTGGAQADGQSLQPSISTDGRYVGFESEATDLVSGDANDKTDVFVAVNPASLAVTSLRGSDRFDTAIKISKAMFPGALPADSGLVLAPGETFPEALCGAPLAAAYGGPVLLTPAIGLNNAVKAEMLRLAPKYVFCVGLSTTVVTQVTTAMGGGVTVTAIRGTGGSVYDMSYRVAKALGTKVGDMSGATAVITRGDVFPDAIGVSPLACSKKWPILLTSSGGGGALHAKATQALSELGITKALKVGTYATLPAGVTGVANLSGADRYFTNVNVAEWGKNNADLEFAHLGIATGDKFPDALAAGPYLALDEGILLLSPLLGPLPAPIAAEITANAADVYCVSFIAMIEPVISQVKALLP
jgi:hypothetical protein